MCVDSRHPQRKTSELADQGNTLRPVGEHCNGAGNQLDRLEVKAKRFCVLSQTTVGWWGNPGKNPIALYLPYLTLRIFCYETLDLQCMVSRRNTLVHCPCFLPCQHGEQADERRRFESKELAPLFSSPVATLEWAPIHSSSIELRESDAYRTCHWKLQCPQRLRNKGFVKWLREIVLWGRVSKRKTDNSVSKKMTGEVLREPLGKCYDEHVDEERNTTASGAACINLFIYVSRWACLSVGFHESTWWKAECVLACVWARKYVDVFVSPCTQLCERRRAPLHLVVVFPWGETPGGTASMSLRWSQVSGRPIAWVVQSIQTTNGGKGSNVVADTDGNQVRRRKGSS